MDHLIRLGRLMGFGWCWSNPVEVTDTFHAEVFSVKRLPLFWLMGPQETGKVEVGTKLAELTKFTLVQVSQLIQDEIEKNKFRGKVLLSVMQSSQTVPTDLVVGLLREYFEANFRNESEGYLICGFPVNLEQARLFELEIGRVNVLIYCTLPLPKVLENVKAKYPDVPPGEIEYRFTHRYGEYQKVYRRYEYKTLKFFSDSAPTDKICEKLVHDLHEYWGYKF